MKTMIKYLMVICIMALGIIACQNDDGPVEPNPPVKGKPTTVQLKLIHGIPATYAASSNEDPTPAEKVIADNLKIYIFDSDGLFENKVTKGRTQNGTSDIYVTDTFKIRTGVKYIYVFSNAPSGITEPSIGTSRIAFEKEAAKVTFSADRPDIATDTQFFISTLWGEKKEIQGTGTVETPEVISLNMGRVAAKLEMLGVVKKGTGSLKGEFSRPSIKVRSIPLYYHLIGQWSNAIPPAPGASVISWAHDKVAELTGGAPNTTDFLTEYAYSPEFNIETGKSIPYYVIENTTNPEVSPVGQQYGNTTHIYLKVKYTPDPSELVDPITGGAGTLPADGTFYTGDAKTGTIIFSSDPNGQPNSGLEDGDVIKKYTEGFTYYRAPIADVNESQNINKYRVLRNHYYGLRVTHITRLGEPDEESKWKPKDPIIEESIIDLQVTVLPWASVIQNIVF